MTQMGDAPALGAGWTKVLTPRRGLLDIPWRELWSYRDLIRLLARRNLALNYQDTLLGPVWFIVQPLFVTLVYSHLFGRMARFGSDNIPHYLFYMSGIVLWSFFADTVNRTSRTFVENSQLFGKIYFPRLAMPISAVATNCIPLLAHLGLLVAGLVFYLIKRDPNVDPNWRIVFVPLLVLQVALFGVGVGCLVAAATNRFRDLSVGMQIGLQLWMFGSAVVFPLSRVANPDDRWMFYLNPMVPVIESFRYAFFGVSSVEAWHIALSAAISVVVFLLGIIVFNQAEQTAVDTI